MVYTGIVVEPTDAMNRLAQKLVALEGNDHSNLSPAFRVIEKLRIVIIRFSGSDGFTALLRRAFALARLQDPSLPSLTFKSDGSIESIKGISSKTGLALTANLLDLMAMFMGQGLTMTLLHDVWPIDV